MSGISFIDISRINEVILSKRDLRRMFNLRFLSDDKDRNDWNVNIPVEVELSKVTTLEGIYPTFNPEYLLKFDMQNK